MEFYARLAPVASDSKYTKVTGTYGRNVNDWGTTRFSGETTVIRRRNETASLPAWVRGKAVFTYPYDVVQLTVGVEAYVRKARLETKLW